MKRAFNILILVIIFTISSSSLSYAQKIAQATMGFLSIDVGARPSAMGGAFVTMSNDARKIAFLSLILPDGIGRLGRSLRSIFLSATSLKITPAA